MALRVDRQPRPLHGRRTLARVAALLAILALGFGPFALAGFAAGGLTMNARIMLQGHARAGDWAAIEVDLQNDGPPIDGELQMNGGTQNTSRYAMTVNMPTGSHQTYVLHAQPPARLPRHRRRYPACTNP